MQHRLILLLATALVANGCYTYTVVTTPPAAGATVDVVLSDAGSTALTATVGPRAARILGELTAMRGDTLHVILTEVRTRDGQAFYMRGTTVVLASEHLSQIRVRTFDRRRTVIASAAGLFGAAALISGVRFGGGGGGDGGGGGTTPP